MTLKCMNCNVEIHFHRFRGKYNCLNFVNGEEEKPFYYGSKYGNND
jgi:hypothetical protein